jgi:hypothetical protein
MCSRLLVLAVMPEPEVNKGCENLILAAPAAAPDEGLSVLLVDL